MQIDQKGEKNGIKSAKIRLEIHKNTYKIKRFYGVEIFTSDASTPVIRTKETSAEPAEQSADVSFFTIYIEIRLN